MTQIRTLATGRWVAAALTVPSIVPVACAHRDADTAPSMAIAIARARAPLQHCLGSITWPPSFGEIPVVASTPAWHAGRGGSARLLIAAHPLSCRLYALLRPGGVRTAAGELDGRTVMVHLRSTDSTQSGRVGRLQPPRPSGSAASLRAEEAVARASASGNRSASWAPRPRPVKAPSASKG